MSRADYLARRSKAKADAVLAAARAIFAREGFEGASMEAIAAGAAVSTATVYKKFPSKIDLFGAVLKALVAEFTAEIAALAPTSDAKLDLYRLAVAYARLLRDVETAALLRAIIAEAPRLPGLSAAFYDNAKPAINGAFEARLNAAIRAGHLKADEPQRIGAALMGIIEHGTLWGLLLLNQPPAAKPEDIAVRALETVYAAFGTGVAAKPAAKVRLKPRAKGAR